MSKKKLGITLIGVGVALLALAAVLYWWFRPIPASDLLAKDIEQAATAAHINYSYVGEYEVQIQYSYTHFPLNSCIVKDKAMMDELFDLLSRTTLHLADRVDHGVEFDDALFDLYFNTAGNALSFRPNGNVYYGNWQYTQGEDTLAEWMSLLERMIDSVQYTGSELAHYQSFFETGSWYAQAVAAPFEAYMCPDLNAMFYDGLSYDENGKPVYGGYVTEEVGAEWDWVRANVPSGDTLDVSRLPREGMRQVLKEVIYLYTEVPEDMAPEGWTYWEETDCYYHAHGDTGINSVTLTGGHEVDDTSGCLEFYDEASGRKCYIHFGKNSTMDNAGKPRLTQCWYID